MKRILWLFSLSFIVLACKVEPQEIAYGHDGCHFCKMTIVDPQHAAQIVTTKGKVFKYDAIECMLNHHKNWDQAPVALYLVTDYDQPRLLINAQDAHFLISEAIPSPMGGFLSAFGDVAVRNQVLAESGGAAHTWESLIKSFNLQNSE